MRRIIGLFGGTFDPVHNGHLRMALELQQRLQLDEMRLLPCHQPPHRDAPGRSSSQRLAMVEAALESCPQLSVDGRELRRRSPSYSVDTLAELRCELGPEVSLCWCVGMDSLATFHLWHRWRDLLDYAHLVVVGRPGWQPPAEEPLASWMRARLAAPTQLRQAPAGALVLADATMLDISATSIRAAIAAGYSAQFLVPDSVWSFIKNNQLYR